MGPLADDNVEVVRLPQGAFTTATASPCVIVAETLGWGVARGPATLAPAHAESSTAAIGTTILTDRNRSQPDPCPVVVIADTADPVSTGISEIDHPRRWSLRGGRRRLRQDGGFIATNRNGLARKALIRSRIGTHVVPVWYPTGTF